jgi:hypothetical protein
VSYLAIGAVTKAMAELLTRKLNIPQLMGATTFRVTALPPDDDRIADETGLNLFLYRVSESPTARNMDWRGDRANPVNGNKPPLALTLSYMLTAYAKKTGGTAQDDISTQQLLGNAMAILHEYPILNDVHDSEFDADLDAQFAPELRNAFEKVKVTLMPISMEEFSKIWTGFSKAYRLSVAYEVSLIEIGPLAAMRAPAAPVQDTALQLGQIGSPAIGAVSPASSPAGAEVSITGANLRIAGVPTTVTVGGEDFDETDLILLTDREIRLAIPTAIQRGPRVQIVVAVGANQSAPAAYTVTPWIASVVPLRGITGIELTIAAQIPAGATVSAEIGGKAAAATVSGASVRTVVPTSIASNGPQPVVLIVNGVRSNARMFEVLPLIQSVAFTTQATPPETVMTLTGERLQGDDVALTAGDLRIRGAANADAGQLSVKVNRVLSTSLPVSVTIDGRQSNVVPPRLDAIEPAQGAVGDTLVFTGAGLSGRAVSVNFGANAVTIGSQAFGSRLKTAVPAGLSAGNIQVTVSVDGRNTNGVQFQVMP